MAFAPKYQNLLEAGKFSSFRIKIVTLQAFGEHKQSKTTRNFKCITDAVYILMQQSVTAVLPNLRYSSGFILFTIPDASWTLALSLPSNLNKPIQTINNVTKI
jgi:hypothetical protein